MSWTETRVARLKVLWNEGLSASQIAADLGGVTRNAVIGKVHRLDLSVRAKRAPVSPARRAPNRWLPRSKGGRKPAAKKPVPARQAQPAKPPLNLPLEQVTGSGCRYPVNSAAPGETHLFCGHPPKTGSPYCPAHDALCHPVDPPKADGRKKSGKRPGRSFALWQRSVEHAG